MIRLILGFVRRSDKDILSSGWAIYDGLLDNPYFPDPPVKLSDFKAALDSFVSAAAQTLVDGGRKAYAERDRQRAILIKMMRHLGHFVEVIADGESLNWCPVDSRFQRLRRRGRCRCNPARNRTS